MHTWASREYVLVLGAIAFFQWVRVALGGDVGTE